MKKIFVLFLMSSLVLVLLYRKSFKNEKPQTPPNRPTFEESLSKVDESYFMDVLSHLSSDELEGRMSGKTGNVKAAEYIKFNLERCGLPTATQQFRINRVNSGPKNEVGDDFTKNVYAWLEGKELKNEIVVVGAHFDHIGYGPKYSRSRSSKIHNGADDNASGTAVVLAIARAMSGMTPKRTIVFQFYSAEEMGLLGSRFYCENPIFPIDSPDIKKHIAMINLDMVGHLSSEFKVSLPEGTDMKSAISDLGKKYSFAPSVTSRTGGGSDHASFHNKRIPVAFIHTGLHKYYHTPEDDFNTLNIKGIVQISKYAMELTWKIANEDKPTINATLFKEMPYTHDHDASEF